MFIGHIDEIEKKELDSPELKGVTQQVPIGPEQGWEDYVMRVFTLQAGGHTPKHSHPWPHINYVLKGEGVLHHEGEETPIRAGSVAYLPGGTNHQFVNKSEGELSFICIVPKEGAS
ncbi:MAG: cupin domain-containing protein [Spirochaetia bacterium]